MKTSLTKTIRATAMMIGVNIRRFPWPRLFFMAVLAVPATAWFLDIGTANWTVAALQIALFVALVGCCIEQTGDAGDEVLVFFLLICAVISSILAYTVFYTRSGLMEAGSSTVFFPEWRDALYVSLRTFISSGPEDLATPDEFRAAATVQQVLGFLYFGVFVALIAGAFRGRLRVGVFVALMAGAFFLGR